MDLHFVKATGIFLRTLPFVLLRIVVGVLFGVLAVIYFGLVAWTLFSLADGGTISSTVALVGLLLAGLLFAWVVRLARRYVLYLVSAAHIAVIAHIVETGDVPGRQLSYGSGVVRDNFTSASALFAVDELVKGIVKQFNGSMTSFSGVTSFAPGLKNVIEILRRAIALAATYIDEAILAHMLVSDEENPWRAARDGVVLYAKSWKPVLASTLIIVVAMYLVVLLLLVALSPIAGVFGRLSPAIEMVGWAIFGGVALTVYIGFLRPWVKTVVVTTFLLESRELSPDVETAEWIRSKSEKFDVLLEKADEERPAESHPDGPDVGEPSPRV